MDQRNFHRVAGKDAEIAETLATAAAPYGIVVSDLVAMCGGYQQFAKLMAQLKNLVDVKRLAAGYPELYQGEDPYATEYNGRPIVWDGIFKWDNSSKQLSFVSTTDGTSVPVSDDEYVMWIINAEELSQLIRK